MIFPRILISCLFFFLCTATAGAQDKNYVYRDTSIVEVDSLERALAADEEPLEDTEESVEEEIVYIDTSLVHNGLTVDSDSLLRLKKQSAFAYARNLDSLLNEYQRRQKEESSKKRAEPSWLERFFLSSATMYFFWLVAATFIVFILYKLFFAEGFFQRSYKRSPVVILHEEAESLSQHTDFQRLINTAIQQQNYRLAVRYYYLQSLQKLAAKSLIEYAPDKTNFEYLRELSGKKFRNDFAALTLNYEYAWYGEFEITAPVFEKIQQKFKQFYSVLN